MEIYEVDAARKFYIYPKKKMLMNPVPEKKPCKYVDFETTNNTHFGIVLFTKHLLLISTGIILRLIPQLLHGHPCHQPNTGYHHIFIHIEAGRMQRRSDPLLWIARA